MPVLECENGKFRIGTGQCMYDSKAAAERAYKGYLGAKHMHKRLSRFTKMGVYAVCPSCGTTTPARMDVSVYTMICPPCSRNLMKLDTKACEEVFQEEKSEK